MKKQIDYSKQFLFSNPQEKPFGSSTFVSIGSKYSSKSLQHATSLFEQLTTRLAEANVSYTDYGTHDTEIGYSTINGEECMWLRLEIASRISPSDLKRLLEQAGFIVQLPSHEAAA